MNNRSEALLILKWLLLVDCSKFCFHDSCEFLYLTFSLLPCRLQDVAGYGVALAVKGIYADAFGERNLNSNLVDLMVKDGRQGMLDLLLLILNLIFYMMAQTSLDECTFCIFFLRSEKFQITVLQER